MKSAKLMLGSYLFKIINGVRYVWCPANISNLAHVPTTVWWRIFLFLFLFSRDKKINIGAHRIFFLTAAAHPKRWRKTKRREKEKFSREIAFVTASADIVCADVPVVPRRVSPLEITLPAISSLSLVAAAERPLRRVFILGERLLATPSPHSLYTLARFDISKDLCLSRGAVISASLLFVTISSDSRILFTHCKSDPFPLLALAVYIKVNASS